MLIEGLNQHHPPVMLDGGCVRPWSTRPPAPPDPGSRPDHSCFTYERADTSRDRSGCTVRTGAKARGGWGDNFVTPVQPLTCQPIARGRRWMSPSAGSRKGRQRGRLEVSLSTIDRMIRKGGVEVAREGRRVYVRMHGLAYLSDDERLRRSIIREHELERTVGELGAERIRFGASSI